MLSIRDNFLETIHGGRPDRFVKQFEYQAWIGDPLAGAYGGPAKKGTEWTSGWGVKMIFPEHEPGGFPVCDGEHKVIKDITRWKEYVHAPNLVLGDEAWKDCVMRADEVDRKEKFVTATVFNGLFEKVHFMMGMEDAMISLYEEPEAMHDFIDFLADWEIELAKEYIKYVHPDCLFHHDDWGTQKSLFMSRDMFDEFLLEPYKKIYGFWKANGVQLIVHHSDSYVADLIPSMIEMGVDVHQGTLDTNRIPEQIRNYGGKLSFMGGLNNGKYDKPDWTRDEIRTGLAGLLEETKGMKYLIPALTMGEPGAIFPGVYDCVDELLRDEFDAKYF